MFLFLPVTLLVHFLLPARFRNGWLLAVSLVFYAWGEPRYVFLMLASIGLNYIFGLGIDAARRAGSRRGAVLWLLAAVVYNVCTLFFFKYAHFAAGLIDAALGTSLVNVLIAIGIAYIPTFARTVRASVLTVKDQEFIEAARSIGCNDREIIFKYIVPNAMAPIIVQATLGLAGAILSIAGLSFLGLGIQPPTPSFGKMLSEAQAEILQAGWYVLVPAAAITLLVMGFNLIGDALQEVTQHGR